MYIKIQSHRPLLPGTYSYNNKLKNCLVSTVILKATVAATENKNNQLMYIYTVHFNKYALISKDAYTNSLVHDREWLQQVTLEMDKEESLTKWSTAYRKIWNLRLREWGLVTMLPSRDAPALCPDEQLAKCSANSSFIFPSITNPLKANERIFWESSGSAQQSVGFWKNGHNTQVF